MNRRRVEFNKGPSEPRSTARFSLAVALKESREIVLDAVLVDEYAAAVVTRAADLSSTPKIPESRSGDLEPPQRLLNGEDARWSRRRLRSIGFCNHCRSKKRGRRLCARQPPSSGDGLFTVTAPVYSGVPLCEQRRTRAALCQHLRTIGVWYTKRARTTDEPFAFRANARRRHIVAGVPRRPQECGRSEDPGYVTARSHNALKREDNNG